MSTNDTSGPAIGKVMMGGAGLAVLGIVLVIVGFVTAKDHNALWGSYLIGFVMWNNISVSFLGLLLLHHMVGGDWGYINRRFFEAGAMLCFMMAIVALPILFAGLPHLYQWIDPAKVATDHIISEKAPYLNGKFFVVRVVLYYVFWLSYAFLMFRLSSQVDETGSPSYRTRVRFLSGPGIFFYVLLFTFYQVDFLMSLEVHWTSTIFAILEMVGAALAAMSIVAILMWMFKDTFPLSTVLTKGRFWDVGNMMLMFTMLFAYMGFSQYLISWSGNTPEESEFYQHRLAEGVPYRWIALGIVLLHFAIPFFILLQRTAKKAPGALASVGVLLIIMRWVDIFWIVRPSFWGEGHEPGPLYWPNAADLGVPMLIGGLWFVVFTFLLRAKRILPVWETHHDRPPVKSEAYTHG